MGTVKTQATKFDLKALGRALKESPAWHAKKRNSAVLFKGTQAHVYLMAMHAATRIPDHSTPCAVNIHVLQGRVRIVTKDGAIVLAGDGLVALEAGTQYGLASEKESLFVLEFFPLTSKHTFSGEQDDYFDNWV